MLPLIRNFLIAFVIAGLIFGPLAYLLTNVVLDCIGPSFGIVSDTDTLPSAPSVPSVTGEPSSSAPDTGPDEPGVADPDGGAPFNLLIVGTDYQPDLLKDYDNSTKTEYPLFEERGTPSATTLSDYLKRRRVGADTFYLLRVDTVNRRILYSALPADMLVRSGGTDLSLSDLYTTLGMTRFMEKINVLTGFSVDYYAVLAMKDVEKMVDSIGGVTVSVPFIMRYTDKDQDLEIDIRSGTQKLDGKNAVDFIRFNGYPEGSPYSRITSANAFCEAFASAFASQATLQKLEAIFDLLSGQSVTTFPASLLPDYTDLLSHLGQYERVSVTYPGRYSYSAEEGTLFIPDTNSAILIYSNYR
ncbi:MAG: LCP family protein [Clostridia bacterium]|nr:LCP family protein [Clostridia bacterium]